MTALRGATGERRRKDGDEWEKSSEAVAGGPWTDDLDVQTQPPFLQDRE
jgi:hypothetical protein